MERARHCGYIFLLISIAVAAACFVLVNVAYIITDEDVHQHDSEGKLFKKFSLAGFICILLATINLLYTNIKLFYLMKKQGNLDDE